jgi:hypothetical protein
MKKIFTCTLALLLYAATLTTNAATYKEAGGVVVVEAEHFDVRTVNADGHRWAIMPDENGNPDTAADAGFANARGGKYMQSLPDAAGGGAAYNTAATVGIDPHLDIRVQISNPGRYRLWIRWGGYDGSSDSMFGQIVEMKSPAGPGPDWYRFVGNNADFDARAWDGSGAPSTDAVNNNSAGGGEVPAVWDITTAGTYTIRLGMREDGSAVDAIIFQLESLPAPSGRGPAESATTAAADSIPPTIVEAKTAGNPNGVLVVFSEGVSSATATNKANYAIDNGVTVNSVSPGQNNFSVVVNTTAIAPGRAYNLTINGVQDTAGNNIAANTKALFYQVDGIIERRVFLVTGGNLAALTNSIKYSQNLPDDVTYPTSIEGPVNYLDNYSTQFRGYITPQVTGNYVFFICSDDPSNLFLSTDDNPANKKLIAAETVWSDTRDWVSSGGASDLTAKRSDQYADTAWPTGNTITLTAGRRYYLEAIHTEGGGGDNVAVTWMLPGAAEPVDGDPPIPGQYLSAFGVNAGPVAITTQPSSQTATELLSTTFAVKASGSPPFSYQWLRNGTAIANATGASYTIARTAAGDNAAKFSVRVSNPFSTVTSSEATLTVNVDKTPPVLLGAKGSPGGTNVVLTFSERVSQASANALANYKIVTGAGAALNVTAAALSTTDPTKVTLTTAQQTIGTKYVVTVNNVTDQAGAPNAIAANSKTAFFPAGPIVEQNGFIVFEAESYDRNLDGIWVRDTTRGTPSGGVSMVAPNGAGGSEAATKLEYDVEFKQAATYIIWYKASGNDGSDDSSWFHIDGERPAERLDGNSAAMTGFSGALDFVWLSDSFGGTDPMSVDIAAPGVHVVGLARREDGSFFDKFILTTDTAFTPSGNGPPETRQGLPPAPTVTLTSPTEGQTFAAGANITLSANATASAGIDMARVEFSANGVIVGQATQSPFTFTWSGAKDGSYLIRAIGTDEVGSATTSAPIQIKVGNPPPLIYFVTADPGPLTFAGDIAVQQRLLKRGFDVRLARGSDIPADGSTARGASLIIQSSSLGSGTVENVVSGVPVGKFRDLAIPAMVWESSNEDAFGFQELNGIATAADQTQINIVDPTSPLAAGLPKGLVTVSTAQPFSGGNPVGAHIVATAADDPSLAVIYNYDKGEKGYNGFVMPERRVFFFFGDITASVATADGLKLFDAAVDWLLGGQVVPPPKPQFTKIAKNADGTITIEWTGAGALEAAAAVTGPWQAVPGATSPYTFRPTATMLFGRIKN